MPKPSKWVIEGPIPDHLLGGGEKPRLDATSEYMAGGGPGFPLTGQLILSKSIDDLTRDLGHRVYEQMLMDPTVASAFFSLVTGILNGRFQILPRFSASPGEVVPKGSQRETDIRESQLAADFINRMIARLPRPIKETSFEMLYSMAYGSKLAEKVFEEGDGQDANRVVLKRLRCKRNDAWQMVITPFGDLVAFRGLIIGGGLVDMPPQKFMCLTWMPQDSDPRGHSILRPAYNGWNLKINTWAKLYTYLDRFGTPFIIGTAAENAPDEQLYNDNGTPTGTVGTPTQAMAQMLGRLTGGSYAAVRAGSKVDLYQPTTNGEAFMRAIDLYKHEILEGILMTARASLEAEHGSKTDTDQAEHLVARLIAYGREQLDFMYEKQLFHHLLEINNDKAYADAYTPIASHGEVEKKDIAKIISAYTQAGWQADPGQYPHMDLTVGFPPRRLTDGQGKRNESQELDINNDEGVDD